MTEVSPDACPCARVLAKSWRVEGLGAFWKGQLIPINHATALSLVIGLARKNETTGEPEPAIEVTVGIPQAPADPIDPTKRNAYAVPLPEPSFKRATVEKWAKDAVRKRELELMATHLPSFFEESKKTPRDMAADEVFAKRCKPFERDKQRRQEAVDLLLAELPKQAEALRAQAAEAIANAERKEKEAAMLAEINAPAARERYELRVKLERLRALFDRYSTDPKQVLDGSKIHWLAGEAKLARLRDLVERAFVALDSSDVAESVRLLTEIEQENESTPSTASRTGFSSVPLI